MAPRAENAGAVAQEVSTPMQAQDYDERERLRAYLTRARSLIEAFDPELHEEIAADPMWTPDDVIRIPLRDRGGNLLAEAIVDADDAYVTKYRWCIAKGYAARGNNVKLHRFLMGLSTGDGRQVDHINGDRLDNRRCNLRVVSHAENRQNVPGLDLTSKHRGVSYRPRRGCWEARGWKDGRNVFIGHYATEQEAADAAREWRSEHMPFANNERSTIAAGPHWCANQPEQVS